jgi:hypothetical protein
MAKQLDKIEPEKEELTQEQKEKEVIRIFRALTNNTDTEVEAAREELKSLVIQQGDLYNKIKEAEKKVNDLVLLRGKQMEELVK